MVSFGIISEGITDQIVIENILAGYFDNPDISVNELQPLRDETDRNRRSVEDCIRKARQGMKEHIGLLREMKLPVPLKNPNAEVIILHERELAAA